MKKHFLYGGEVLDRIQHLSSLCSLLHPARPPALWELVVFLLLAGVKRITAPPRLSEEESPPQYYTWSPLAGLLAPPLQNNRAGSFQEAMK